MKANEFFASLRQGVLLPCYLFEGEEEHLKDSALAQLRAAILLPPFGDMNETVLEDPNADQLIACCETLPMMAGKRLVVVREPSLLSAAREGARAGERESEQIFKYLNRLPDTLCLVFFVRGKANGTRKLYKEVAKLGGLVQFEQLDQDALIKWVAREMKGYGKQVSVRAAERLLFLSGRELIRLKGEIAKACAYAGDREAVEEGDIDAICTATVEYKVFDLADKVAEGRAREAVTLMNSLISGGEQRLLLLALLARQYRQLLLAAIIRDAGEAARVLGAPPFAVKKLMSAARRFTVEQLRRGYALCIDTEYMVKSGQMPEEGSLEKTVFALLAIAGEGKQHD